MTKLKSKKFVVYFYENKDGGTICATDERGKMAESNEETAMFGDRKGAIVAFEYLCNKYLAK